MWKVSIEDETIVRDLLQILFDNHVNNAPLYLVDATPEQSPFCM